MACMMIAMNVELFLRHGNRGRYNPTTPEKIEALLSKAEHHVMQDVRYPYLNDPLPCLEDEQAQLEKEIANNRMEQESAEGMYKCRGMKHQEELRENERKKKVAGDVATQLSIEDQQKRRDEEKQKHKDKKRRLFLEQKELAALQKANEEAQKRGSKRDAEGEDPRITQAAVERRILKRVDDAKRRKRANLQEEAD